MDAERKDEMTLTLNQSFQRQVQAAEQREQETKLQLEKEKDRYQQLITNLQTEIHEEVREGVYTVYRMNLYEYYERYKSVLHYNIFICLHAILYLFIYSSPLIILTPAQLEQHSKAVERIERDHRQDLDRLTLTTNTLINKHQEQITSLQADLLTKDKERDELIAKYSYENKQVIEYNETRIIEIYEKEKLDMISAIEEREDIIEQLSVQVNTLLSEQSALQAQIKPNSIFGLKSTKYDALIIMTGVVCVAIGLFYMDNNIYIRIYKTNLE